MKGIRLIGIDFGRKRIGIAISDELGLIASPLKSIVNRDGAEIEEIRSILSETGAAKIVLGYPINMDGSVGPKALEAEKYKCLLEGALAVEVDLWDERLTTATALERMREEGLTRKKRKKAIDAAAAQVILSTYLDAHQRGGIR